MARMKILNAEKLGAIIKKHALEEPGSGATRDKFINDAANLIKDHVSIPNGHKIHVLSDEDANDTWMILPSEDELRPIIAAIQAGPVAIPAYYSEIVTLSESNDVSDRLRAYDMRLADYLMARFL